MTSKTMLTNYRRPLRAYNSPHSTDLPPFSERRSQSFTRSQRRLDVHAIESRPPKANSTVLPNLFLKRMTPICLIQHAASTFPYLHHSAQFDFRGLEIAVQASLRSSRLLVDRYAIATGAKPMVLDGDELIHKRVAIEKFCNAISISESEAQMSWDATSQAEIRG